MLSVLHDRSQSERDTRPSAPLPDGLRRARTPGVPHRGPRPLARDLI